MKPKLCPICRSIHNKGEALVNGPTITIYAKDAWPQTFIVSKDMPLTIKEGVIITKIEYNPPTKKGSDE